MTDKELGKLNRRQLLEMLLEQTRRAEELEAKLAEKDKQLADRHTIVEKAATINQATLELNKALEAAQNASSQYLETVTLCSLHCSDMLASTKKRCADMEKQAMEKIKALKAEAERFRFNRDTKPSE